MQDLTLPSGALMPKYGMGTWHMGERGGAHAQETAALVAGLDAGAHLIDTAEMYANGGAEQVIAPAIKDRRDEVFIVSKVLPSNASRSGVLKACERSLERLRHRPHRPVPAALAGRDTNGRNVSRTDRIA